jgi:hypothetical protein
MLFAGIKSGSEASQMPSERETPSHPLRIHRNLEHDPDGLAC